MNDPLFANNHLVATEEGYFVDQRWAYLAQIIEDYNPQLELRWIPPNLRTVEDGAPYVVVHRQRDGLEYAVLYASELDSPQDVLERIFNADMKHGNVMDRMRNRNTAAQLFQMQAKIDAEMAKQDLAAWMINDRDKKNWKTYKKANGDLVKLDDRLNPTIIKKGQ